MAYILLQMKTPATEVINQGEIFSTGKLPKLPDFVKRTHTFVYIDDMVQSLSLYQVPDDKLFEGMKALNQRCTGYFGIQGVSFKVNPLMEIKDALSLVGL
ncbi:MAG: hypothetical protein EU532_10885 [Promethearchaeota archaeon]|nr:MAG: hypothetical protein EU532_10885 [Candidatus Lokiarchaeota archaeon]